MKHFISIAIASIILAAAVPGASAANPAQTGTGTLCAEFNVLYIFGITTGLSEITVQAGSIYEVSADLGTAYVDFFNSAGTWLDWNEGASSGVVPAGSAFGVLCVGTGILNYPEAPIPTATWTYQDGF